jgi:hypothetical protein
MAIVKSARQRFLRNSVPGRALEMNLSGLSRRAAAELPQ